MDNSASSSSSPSSASTSILYVAIVSVITVRSSSSRFVVIILSSSSFVVIIFIVRRHHQQSSSSSAIVVFIMHPNPTHSRSFYFWQNPDQQISLFSTNLIIILKHFLPLTAYVPQQNHVFFQCVRKIVTDRYYNYSRKLAKPNAFEVVYPQTPDAIYSAI